VREVARGGMGAVFEAVHEASRAKVAVKTLLPDGFGPIHEEERARFRREAEALAALDHPHVVRVHAAELDGPTPWLAQDLLTGGSLQERLARDGPLPVPDAVALLLLLARAVAHAHARGLLHRDLKPSNVLFDELGAPRLVDFGIVFGLTSAERLTTTGEIVGTPAYMSPEQARGAKVGDTTVATDVYGLGGLLYATLTGVPPCRGATSFEALSAVMTRPPTPPREVREDVPVEVEAVCLRALAKTPGERFASAEAFAAALEAAAAGAGPAAAPGWAAYALALASGAAVCGLVLAVGYALKARPIEPVPVASEPARPGPAAQARSWFDRLPEGRRPRALPEGLSLGEREGEYVNARDGSILVWVPPATFTMGSVAKDELASPDEMPAHRVTLTSGFFMGKHEVTWAQLRAFCAATGQAPPTPRFEAGPDHPAHAVSHDLAKAYCAWAGLRLPTEEEWELSARGTDGRRFPWGDAPPGDAQLSWSGADGYEQTAPVGSFPLDASPFGCLDMGGNVREWCSTNAGEYHPEPRVGSKAAPSLMALLPATRGGGWRSGVERVRAADRLVLPPDVPTLPPAELERLARSSRWAADLTIMTPQLGLRACRDP
jgi:formylglycine-generating enzyme required for sulfatase activity